ncbi:MAG: metallophosphoesterase family protein [Myxococcota bacterium]
MSRAEPALSPRIVQAVARARDCAASPRVDIPPDGRERTRVAVVGDPQAPIAAFFAVLDHHRLLGDDGWLVPDIALISIGDHFDWGGRAEREEAVASGLQLLAWLAAHPRDQVITVAGNHDLCRLGELADFDDDDFAAAHTEAVLAYRDGHTDPDREADFLSQYPALPSVEVAARDMAAFSVAQRDLVAAMIRAGRMRAAVACGGILLSHAGVTSHELAALGIEWPMTVSDSRPERCADSASIASIAAALSEAVAAQVAGWTGGALHVPGLHRPGDSRYGEGRGMFFHRPCNPASEGAAALLSGEYRRRYDPRQLPRGVVQAVGHISDRKCRKLLGPWAHGAPARPGQLRHLRSDSDGVRYAAGLPEGWSGRPVTAQRDAALMIFTDGGMRSAPTRDYQLLELAPAAL